MLQFLVTAALSCSFALLAPLYGRRFVEFFLPEVADYAVAGALSLKSSERAFNRLVFADFNGRHAFFNPPSPCAVIFQMLNYYTKPRPQSQLFPTRFAIIFSPFPSPVISSGGQSPQSRNLPTAIKFARVLNFIYAGFSRNDIWVCGRVPCHLERSGGRTLPAATKSKDLSVLKPCMSILHGLGISPTRYFDGGTSCLCSV